MEPRYLGSIFQFWENARKYKFRHAQFMPPHKNGMSKTKPPINNLFFRGSNLKNERPYIPLIVNLITI